MALQTDEMTFLFFSVIIMQLYTSSTHYPKATKYFKNTVKSLTCFSSKQKSCEKTVLL